MIPARPRDRSRDEVPMSRARRPTARRRAGTGHGMRLGPAGPEAAQTLAALHAQAFDKPWSAQDIAALIGGAGAYAVMAQDEEPLGMVMATCCCRASRPTSR